jgi:hypothetical protein
MAGVCHAETAIADGPCAPPVGARPPTPKDGPKIVSTFCHNSSAGLLGGGAVQMGRQQSGLGGQPADLPRPNVFLVVGHEMLMSQCRCCRVA